MGVACCGRSAGCVLCVLWAVSAAVLGEGGGYPVGVSISSEFRIRNTATQVASRVRLHKKLFHFKALLWESIIL